MGRRWGRSAYLMKDAPVDLGDYFSLFAVLVAIFALFYSGSQAHAAKDSADAARVSAIAAEDQARAVEDQTQLQRDLAKVAADPNLWVDIRADDVVGQELVLLVGNSGPSIARNVKVTFDPPVMVKYADLAPVLETLREGISALAPGRTLQWHMGPARFTVDWDASNVYRVRIEADGPLGAVDPLEYAISIDDLALSKPAPTGSLLAVTTQLQDISSSARQLSQAVAKLQGDDLLTMMRRRQQQLADGQRSTETKRGAGRVGASLASLVAKVTRRS
jgi:hypothetical protein